MRRILLLVLLVGCAKKAPQAAATPEKLPFLELGDFPYTEGMPLPENVLKWNKKNVLATGYINPGTQTRNITKFLLVKDLGSCCFGKSPQTNHFIDVTLKSGQEVHYSRDPVTIRGVLEIGEVKDGDWVLCVYSMKDVEVMK